MMEIRLLLKTIRIQKQLYHLASRDLNFIPLGRFSSAVLPVKEGNYIVQKLLDEDKDLKTRTKLSTQEIVTVSKQINDQEKIRFAHLMAYGHDPTQKALVVNEHNENRLDYLSRRKLGSKMKTSDEDTKAKPTKDRFDELMDEIQERREFLDYMKQLGREKEYKTQIETEISQMVREMELIDLKRTKELKQLEQSSGDN